MKKLLALLTVAALLLPLAACREERAAVSSPSPSPVSSPAPGLSAQELLSAALTGCAAVPEHTEALSGEDLETYPEAAYALSPGAWSDAAVLRGVGVSAFEVAALVFPDEAAAQEGEAALTAYLPDREGTFAGYAPQEAQLVAQALVCRTGLYVGLFVCAGPDGAQSAFTAAAETGVVPAPTPTPASTPTPIPSAPAVTPAPTAAPAATPILISIPGFGSTISVPVSAPSLSPSPSEPAPANTPAPPASTPTPGRVHAPTLAAVHWAPLEEEEDPDYPGRMKYSPEKVDEQLTIYDTSPILSAWAAKDPSGLSEYDRTIYDRAAAVLEEILWEGMSDYQKEVAIYAWVVQNVNYDSSHMDVLQDTVNDSYTPYGPLVNKVAVCLGNASVFQLLMDLSGVECITVLGAGIQDSAHAWNMVRLGEQWYCLDVSWDSNYREQLDTDGWTWRFFNVTSDYMAASHHKWDYSSVPEATAQDHGAP